MKERSDGKDERDGLSETCSMISLCTGKQGRNVYYT